MNTIQMLEKLQYSKSALISSRSKEILKAEGEERDHKIDVYKRLAGSFFKTVLEGNYEKALVLADPTNYRCLVENSVTETSGRYKGYRIVEIMKGENKGKFLVFDLNKNFFEREKGMFILFNDVQSACEIIDALELNQQKTY